MRFTPLIACLLPALNAAAAGPAVTDPHIKVDQFGYRSAAQKVGVISNPVTGYNTPDPYSPTPTTFEVRRWSDQSVAYTGSVTAWNGGATDTGTSGSGDKAWWFDFSTLTTIGDYYLYDPNKAVGSYRFEIRDDIYLDVLKHAVRSFFYQRCGQAKQPPYVPAAWADSASHMGTQQDLDCRLVSNTSITTSKDLSRGWYDAGDYNKYTNFTDGVIHDLLFAYQENPSIWGDDYNIPESGNGVPDLLDEAKWGLDWMLKMQTATGNGSLLHKVSVTTFGAGSPPSADANYRRYAPATASATISGAGAFAHAAIVYKSLSDPGMQAFGATLQAAAEQAWSWLVANPGLIPSSYNNAGFVNVDAEDSGYWQGVNRSCAAAYLYGLTGNAAYRTYFDANYTAADFYQWYYPAVFEAEIHDAFLYYTSLPGATASVVTNIRSRYTSGASGTHLGWWTGNVDPYRANIEAYTWGSNRTKAAEGSIYWNMIVYNMNAANATNYRNAAESYVHYIHGVNPMGWVYMSNMNAYGAENSINEFYHSWFTDGSAAWDRVGTSTYGPAPGFLPGGPNPSYSKSPAIVPPMSQPDQKSYKDWNTSWPEDSWEITENSTGYQSAYIKLLSKFVMLPVGTPTPSPSFTASPSPSPTRTGTRPHTPSLTDSPSSTETPQLSPTPTPTDSPLHSPTRTASPTRTDSRTASPTRTVTLTYSVTRTFTPAPPLPCPRNVWLYYPYWSQATYNASDIPYSKLTHIAHSFIYPNADGTLSMAGSFLEPALVSNAHAAGVKVIVSLGGAGSGSQHFPAMAASPATRAAFCDNLEAFMRTNGYDGVDVDWEFPDDALDRANLNLLIQELRAKFEASPAPAPDWIISAAISWGSWYGQWWDVGFLKDYMDYFNVMVYDMHGPWESKAGHNGAMKVSSMMSSAGYSTYSGENALNYYIGRGVPAHQLQYGLAFYGYRYTNEDIYQFCSPSCSTTYEDYSAVAPMVGAGWTRSYDSVAESPYLRDDAAAGLICYDDVQSIAAKSNYALWTRGCGGIFAWEITQDKMADGSQPLLDAMWSAANACAPTPTASPSPSATPGPSSSSEPPRIEQCLPVPNPNSGAGGALRLKLAGPAADLRLEIYSPALQSLGSWSSGPYGAGWVSLPLPADFLQAAPNGIYFYRVESRLDQGGRAESEAKGKFVILK